jgi:oxygen-independent coproporphyrinogen-3 oxidase
MAEYLYIHMPFCFRKCIYCDFLSVPYDDALAIHYTEALCRELELKKEQAQALKTVYIGGGTPSILPVSYLEKIFVCLKENYKFMPSAEITLEANPGTLTKQKIEEMLSLDVNRLSLGVQSFIDRELTTLGRIHTSEEAVRSVHMARAAGLGNLSLDLMYGIPGQSVSTWKESLAAAVALSPNHISAYELTPEKSTHLYRLLQSGSLVIPAEDPVLEMYAYAIDMLASSGYEHYEISNYAMPGYRCMHNVNYWDRGEYLAAGAGAHSFIRGYRSKNTGNIQEYIEKLGMHIIPEVESTEIPCEDAFKEFIFLGLRKVEGIRLHDADELGLDLVEASADLVRAGLIEVTSDSVRLTRKGLPLSNVVIVRLFGNLGL